MPNKGEDEKNAGISIILDRTKELPEGVKPRDLTLMGNGIPEKFRDKGIFVWGCPPWEMHPAWPIIERRWIDDMGQWNRNCGDERSIFIDYLKKLGEKSRS